MTLCRHHTLYIYSTAYLIYAYRLYTAVDKPSFHSVECISFLVSCETAGEAATSNGASSSVVTRQAAAHVKEPEAQQNIRKSIEEEEDESEYAIEDDINHDRGAWLITSGCGSISFPSSTRETTCFKLFLFWIGLVIGTISLRHHPTIAVLLL